MPANPVTEQYVLTADIGGSHITTAICDLTKRMIIKGSLTRVELRSRGSSESILLAWKTALEDTIRNTAVSFMGLGIAIPGPFDYSKGISYIQGLNKYDALYGLNIKEYFATLLGLDPEKIKFRNDAEATIAGEVMAGAGKGFGSVLGVTLGTGFGSAYYKNHITRDLNLGIEPFRDTIADDILSSRWFLKRYFALTGISVTGVKELAELSSENKTARLIFKEFANNMGDFLQDHLNLLNPDALIISGNIAKASRLFSASLKNKLNNRAVIVGGLGEEAALLGAASLFINEKQYI